MAVTPTPHTLALCALAQAAADPPLSLAAAFGHGWRLPLCLLLAREVKARPVGARGHVPTPSRG